MAAGSLLSGNRLGLIAGAGQFPFHVARAAKAQGLWVFAVGISGWVDASLARAVDGYAELPVGQLSQVIAHLKTARITQAVMAGKVAKAAILNPGEALDAEMRVLLSQVKGFSVNDLLGAVAHRLAREGIQLLDSSSLLASSLCPVGSMTRRGPTAQEETDIAVGVRSARQLAALDIGQTVIVRRGVVVAVEAVEGTDAAIARAHELVGEGLVVVKVGSPTQDRRFDLPVVGLETLQTARRCRVSCLAVEAGSTLLLDRQAVIDEANEAKICLIGVAVDSATGA